MITFNGVDFSTLEWVTITHIGQPVCAPFSNNIRTIDGINTSYDFGYSLEPKVFEIKCALETGTDENTHAVYRKLLQIIYGSELREFYINQSDEVRYMARLHKEPSVNKISNQVNEVTFELICPDPYGYGQEVTQEAVLLNEGVMNHTLNSLVEVKPVITVENMYVPPVPLNTNGDFENNKTGWTFQNTGGSNGAFTVDTSIYHSGTRSGKLLKQTTAGTPRLYFTFDGYDITKDYYVTAWVRCSRANGLTLYGEEETPDWQYPQVTDTMTNGNVVNEWVKVESKVTPTASGGTVYFFFELRHASSYELYIDDVQLVQSSGADVVVRNLKVSLNNRTVEYAGLLAEGDSLVLNCDKWSADLNGSNVLFQIDGAFPELRPGANSLKVASNNVPVKLRLDYREKEL